MRNPDKFVRKGYAEALIAQGIPTYNKDIPVDVNPLPDLYVLIESQSKSTTERSKEDFEWNCRVTLHIIKLNTRGYTSTTTLDDAEGICITAIENGILIDNFHRKSTYLIESIDLDMTDKTSTIERRVLIYEHWLAERSAGSTGPINGGGGITPIFTPIIIPVGTPVPFFIPISENLGFNSDSEVITEIIFIDPETNNPTGQLTRVFDMPVVKQDSNGDGTGTFTGWNIYGHSGDELEFQEDTYISLK